MTIFVTGATGYVGTQTVKALIQKGYAVTALVRPSSNYHQIAQLGATVCFGDVADLTSLEHAARGSFESVIHLAFSLFPANDPKVNREGIRNMIHVFRNRPLRRFIFVSSALVYGPTAQDAVIHEEMPCMPNMTFARQQIDAEQAFREAFTSSGLPVVILRPSEIFGGDGGYFKDVYVDGIVEGKVPVIGPGTTYVSMTHVDDVVQALLLVLEKDGIDGQIFNINLPDVMTTNDLVNVITTRTGSKTPLRIPTPVAWVVASFSMLLGKMLRIPPFLHYDLVRVATLPGGRRDIRKAQTLLGFTPRYHTIVEGLEACYF